MAVNSGTGRVATSASRVDRPSGVRERAEFFGTGHDQLFGCTHVPPRDVRALLVICPPIFVDFIHNYRKEVLLSRALAARGVAVIRFHYRGTGNSDGEPSDVTFDTMCADAHAALQQLQHQCGEAAISFMGTRWGGLVATAVATRHPGAPLVLWEPVLEARRFFREGFRARMMRDVKEGTSSPSGQLTRELEKAGRVDVLGHSVDQLLYNSAPREALSETLGTERRPILLAQLDPRRDLRAEYRKLTSGLSELGFAVDVRLAGGQGAWWFLDDQSSEGHDLVAWTADWLERQIASEVTA